MKKLFLILIVMLIPVMCQAKSTSTLVKVDTIAGIEYYADVDNYTTFDNGTIQVGMGTIDNNNGFRTIFMMNIDREDKTYMMLNCIVVMPSGETTVVPTKGEELHYVEDSVVDKTVKIINSRTGEKT